MENDITQRIATLSKAELKDALECLVCAIHAEDGEEVECVLEQWNLQEEEQ